MESLKQIIATYSEKGKLYEKDFFPVERTKTAEGRFELLSLSVMDVNGYNADRLWYKVGPKLGEQLVLTIDNLIMSEVIEIKDQLIRAGYNRGEAYTKQFAEKLKNLAFAIDGDPYKGDVSYIFNNLERHNLQGLKSILKSLFYLPGVGQKVGTMYLKFMMSTFSCWVWAGEERDLWEIALPNDIQVRKVFSRLTGRREVGNLTNDFIDFSRDLQLSFGQIDDVFWNVGIIFCEKSYSACHYCIFEPCCIYAEARKEGSESDMRDINRVALSS